ncbi:3-deoxy-D-manno-octulosonic acid transferase [Bordetella pertussis]|uniref:3-deoxy-D-manno-octulosonic acid transferase n=1 Tax=Bordetella pertussis TaxID=520 RepID=UPI001F034614|nr:3-deoxy-D-manno-octulosonic acid transferase [Bordetella pertussis]ULY75789.1 3-deoxy-D-manno-octulosonic acid transferase [Bordetella pertussis]ULY79246.1 3-deoxy-D-manno-octulosonic acid transferase [Bordetella pertussis]
MGRGVYTLALRGLAPLIWLWMWRRARAGGQWELFAPARFGRAGARAPAPLAAPVWVHAVSLGETRAAQPLVQALLERGLPVLLTHTTATGRAEGERLFGAAIGRGQLQQAWLPYDFPGATRRFLARHAPRCGLLMEREVWPNLLAAARAQGVPMALVSARFSASSLRQAGWLGQALREALAGLDRVLAQTDEDGARLCQAGANAYTVTGSLKFDVALPEAQLRVGHAWAGATGRPVIALASTREGEDAMFIEAIGALQAHRAATPRPLILLIPRHPQRFDEAAAQLQAAGLAYARRSAGSGEPGPHIDVLLGDTLGEMPFYYAAADVAIVGGSFARLGGQNLIEACAAGTPVIVGPHTFNFKDAARDAIAAGAALRAPDARTALDWALQLLAEPARRQAMSEAARAWTAAHAGATRRTLDALEDWLG